MSESLLNLMKWYLSPVRKVADRLYRSPDHGSVTENQVDILKSIGHDLSSTCYDRNST